MNGNFKYTISDTDRNLLHAKVTGSQSKAMASRQMVCEFLQGCLDGALAGDTQLPAASPELPVWARSEVKRLRAEKRGDSYIRGWLQVMARSRG